jgi:hypothetical protein
MKCHQDMVWALNRPPRTGFKSVLTRVETFDDGRSVDVVTPAQDTYEMLVHLSQMHPA